MSFFYFLCVQNQRWLWVLGVLCRISNKSVQPGLAELHTKTRGHCSSTGQALGKKYEVLGSSRVAAAVLQLLTKSYVWFGSESVATLPLETTKY